MINKYHLSIFYIFKDSLVKLNKKLKTIDGIQSPKRCVAQEVTEESGPSKNDIPEKNEKVTVNEPEVVVSDTEIDKSPKVKRKKSFDDSNSSEEIEVLNDGESKTTESLSPPSVNDGEFKDSDVEIIKDKGVKPSGTSEFVTKQELSEAFTLSLLFFYIGPQQVPPNISSALYYGCGPTCAFCTVFAPNLTSQAVGTEPWGNHRENP
ncbi:GSCOCG00010877001-RA-CDS [Cotesia congregata]|nr:GSCOCG00010877001-RA-CDS [Cotesia congregata]